ncbi:hypothetical protein HYQ09_gp021 [Acinetobacter phage vB_AbaM_Konradin]|uniref:Uncharacterized protein n=10 Tax=Lazarusvirus TaxID=2842820 RepID=A0A650EW07_9CAUD|nr:hypothetical protein HYP67_gp025 [Acinetobacter phage vB_ApiM_fHyAci03]YP_009881425.1 hypothetical protein HYP70_gp005 [Acinetobacter phage KARL-1]YP_009885205.1 hypothetical protein HYQ09_gp021 [Acinetobacter phage vB_AbaM_Konradin]YP_009886049.1 hypothetical protein HYQ20_gp022 [Acinetobacter phage vB_AbaM_Berthold]YP_009886299.1 hypothetical protein HYQ21_gp022 [Acinetobacter phage vB_AbaM_Apostate]YP_009886543.1 hypothetical protein HYQ22_gp022 [Acinetobacter phage vB_AbaM_Kimel]YP_009
MISGYAVFYKDKDGFDEALSELGVIKIFPNERSATLGMREYADKITNILNPTKEFKAERKLFGIKTVKEIERPEVPAYARELMTRQLKTMFVKQVKVA